MGENYRLVAIFGDQAASFIQASLQRVFDVAAQGNFKLAYFLFRLFVFVNPPEIRDVILQRIGEAEDEASNTYNNYIVQHEDDIRRGVITRRDVQLAAEQEYYRVLLEVGLRALGDSYARYKTLFKPYAEEVV